MDFSLAASRDTSAMGKSTSAAGPMHRVVFAEDIAGSLFGAASDNVIREDKLTEALLDRNWSRFTGPDYDRGGTEYRYRPPGCR